MTTNTITTCIELFNLLPTTPIYQQLIAADYIQEQQNIEITSNAFRNGTWTPENCNDNETISKNPQGNGDGYSFGNGGGYGFGHGAGFGHGNGWGNSKANNKEQDTGEGNGHGFGNGKGHGGGKDFSNWLLQQYHFINI